jgi:hypothetical protein
MEGRHMLKAIAKWTALLALSGAAQAQNVGLILLYDDNDVLIGSLAAQADFVAWTPTLYKVQIDGATGVPSTQLTDLSGATYNLSNLLYTTADCSSAPYIRVVPGAGQPVGRVVGRVPNAEGAPYTLAAIPPAPTLEQGIVVVGARGGIGGPCVGTGSTIDFGLVLPANDPEVTGVQNMPYTPPLKIESRPVSVWFELFKDGFESGSVVTGPEPFDRTA